MSVGSLGGDGGRGGWRRRGGEGLRELEESDSDPPPLNMANGAPGGVGSGGPAPLLCRL